MKELSIFVSMLVIFHVRGIRKDLNPMNVNLTAFMETMQSCGAILGFEKEFKLNFYGSKDDFNRTLCLSFCALKKLKLYVVEDEIRKQLDYVKIAGAVKLKEEVYKALDECNHLLDDPCKLFDCLLEYARKIDIDGKMSDALIAFFSNGYL